MTKSIPLVSIIIPSYNYGMFIGETLKSCLIQTHKNTEIIVIDDGSTDCTNTVVNGFPEVLYYKQNNQGLSASRNNGVERSNGEYLLFLDSDDQLAPSAIEILLEKMIGSPYVFVAGSFTLFNDKGYISNARKVIQKTGAINYENLLSRNFLVMGAILYDTQKLRITDRFDTELASFEDYDFHLRLLRERQGYYLNIPVLFYRKHSTSMSTDHINMHVQATRVMDKQLTNITEKPNLSLAHANGNTRWNDIFARRIMKGIIVNCFNLNFFQATKQTTYLLKNKLLLRSFFLLFSIRW